MNQKVKGKRAGFALSSELLLIVTIVVLGLIVGMATMRNASLAELEDYAEAIGGTNQSFVYPGVTSFEPSAQTAGGFYEDTVDNITLNGLIPGDADYPGGDMRYFMSTPGESESNLP